MIVVVAEITIRATVRVTTGVIEKVTREVQKIVTVITVTMTNTKVTRNPVHRKDMTPTEVKKVMFNTTTRVTEKDIATIKPNSTTIVAVTTVKGTNHLEESTKS